MRACLSFQIRLPWSISRVFPICSFKHLPDNATVHLLFLPTPNSTVSHPLFKSTLLSVEIIFLSHTYIHKPNSISSSFFTYHSSLLKQPSYPITPSSPLPLATQSLCTTILGCRAPLTVTIFLDLV